ncbi:glycosylhydrolase-like jelly roll fold domain-containing protein, partial [uncultured Duncaniella sp.]
YIKDDFSEYGLSRDIEVPENIAWTHRRNDQDNVDLYFISNQESVSRDFKASFRVDGRIPELWNPMTGAIDKNLSWNSADGRTMVNISLAPAESAFIVFRTPTTETSGVAPVSVESVFDLKPGKWRVRFDTTGKEIRSKELFDWTSSDDNSVRYYSGSAQYTTTFKSPSYSDGSRVLLNLNGLHDVATVYVNGKDCGIVWTDPYRVDITDALRKGKNELVIKVTNTWANAILGADEGKAPFEGIWTNGKYRRADKELIPAGLTGPLTLTIRTVK